jgi:hypothetical protein
LLTQESTSKEVELHEDDPQAVMVLLRYLYGIPYPTKASLQEHAQMFVVAEKYQISRLREEAFDEMEASLEESELSCTFDYEGFVLALRTIFTATTPNNTARKLLMSVCITDLNNMRHHDAFTALLAAVPELAVKIINHPDLKWESPGKWICDGFQKYGDCGGVPMCRLCGSDVHGPRPFEQSFSWRHRSQYVWLCPDCSVEMRPCCSICNSDIRWERPS